MTATQLDVDTCTAKDSVDTGGSFSARNPTADQNSTRRSIDAVPTPVLVSHVPKVLSRFAAGSDSETEYELSPYRYVVLACYFMIKFTSGAIYSLFIPYSDFLHETYGIKHVFTVLTAFTFNAMNPLVTFLYANRLILSKGTKFSV